MPASEIEQAKVIKATVFQKARYVKREFCPMDPLKHGALTPMIHNDRAVLRCCVCEHTQNIPAYMLDATHDNERAELLEHFAPEKLDGIYPDVPELKEVLTTREMFEQLERFFSA